MAKEITCDCGYVVEGADGDERVAYAEQPSERFHRELWGRISREQLLSRATEA